MARDHKARGVGLEWTDAALVRLDQQVDQVRLGKLASAENRALSVGADRVTELIVDKSSRHERLRLFPLGLCEVLLGWGGGPVSSAVAEGHSFSMTQFVSLGLLATGVVLGVVRARTA